VTIQRFGNRDEALQAERLAVANEKPAHNRLLRCARHEGPHRAFKRGVSENKKAVLRMLTMEQVLELVPVGKITLKRMIKNKEFPGPHYISPNKRVWYEDAITLWQARAACLAGRAASARPKGPSCAHMAPAAAISGQLVGDSD
jgi:prophage regulatory protein